MFGDPQLRRVLHILHSEVSRYTQLFDWFLVLHRFFGSPFGRYSGFCYILYGGCNCGFLFVELWSFMFSLLSWARGFVLDDLTVIPRMLVRIPVESLV